MKRQGNKLIIILFMMLSTQLFSLMACARDMRAFNRIPTARSFMKDAPQGAQRVKNKVPVEREKVFNAINKIAANWNTSEFVNQVSDKFYDKDRLQDSLQIKTPRDARLKIMSIRSMSTLNQMIVPTAQGGQQRISTVSVVIDTRTEFHDAAHGFISVPGVNEFILEVSEKF